MTKPKSNPFKEHQRKAVLARWARRSPEERADYARMMVAAREAKRVAATPKTQSDKWAAAGLCVACGGEHRHAKNCQIVKQSFGG